LCASPAALRPSSSLGMSCHSAQFARHVGLHKTSMSKPIHEVMTENQNVNLAQERALPLTSSHRASKSRQSDGNRDRFLRNPCENVAEQVPICFA
jgi:hypothetical protein